MILWKLMLRELRSHRARAILTAVSIIIGVGAVVAVRMSVAAVRQSFGAMEAAVAGQATLQVDAVDGGSYPVELAGQLAAVPGVMHAEPVLERLTVMYSDERRATLVLWGVEITPSSGPRDYELIAGAAPTDDDQLLLDAAYARGLGLELRDSVRLLTRRGRLKATVVGLVQPRSGAAMGRGVAAFLPLATMQRQFDARGQINQIHLTLAEQASKEQVQAEVSRQLPPGLTAKSPAAAMQMGEETLLFFQKALQLSAYFVLLAAVFIVANAFFMNVTQRRRQLALLRALGATRMQIRLLVMREALLLAAIATAAGVLAGWGGAHYLAQALEQLFGGNLAPPRMTASTLVLAVSFGLGVSLLGALFPAARAARVDPLEGMHEVPHDQREGVPRRLTVIGAIGFPLAAMLLASHLAGALPHYDAARGAVLLLIAAVPLFVWTLRPGTRLAAFTLQYWIGAEARLARRQLLARQVRTVLTIGVLFVVSSTGVGLASTLLDNIRDIQGWYRRAMTGDFFLRAMTPDLANWELVEIPEQVESQVRDIPGVDVMYAIRFVHGEVAGQPVMIIAREYPTDDTTGIDPEVIDPARMRRKFHDGEVTIGSVLAQRAGLAPGDTLEILTRRGPQRFRIAALENDYMAGGLTVHIERGVARRRLDVQGADVIVVLARPDQRDAVQKAIQSIADDHGLLLQSYAEVTAMMDQMQSGVIAGLWVVMILGLLVAAMGATNTLSMNVWEQTRELAMLRVIAMTRRQVRRTVVAQALMLGAIGLAPGVLTGLALAWIINRSLAQAIAHPVVFHPHPWLALAGFAVAMILVLMAAWFPARRAGRLDPLDALRYE